MSPTEAWLKRKVEAMEAELAELRKRYESHIHHTDHQDYVGFPLEAVEMSE